MSGAGIDYEEIELSGQLKLLESIKKTTGRTTVPQVVVTADIVSLVPGTGVKRRCKISCAWCS